MSGDRRLTIWMIISWTWKKDCLQYYHWRFGHESKSVQKRCQEGWRIIRSCVACRYVKTSSIIYQICFGQSSWMMTEDLLSSTRKSTGRAVNWYLQRLQGRRKQNSQRQKSVMLIQFFDVRGIFNNEFLPQCQTINQTSQQEDSAAYASLNVQEKTGVVAGKLVAASPL